MSNKHDESWSHHTIGETKQNTLTMTLHRNKILKGILVILIAVACSDRLGTHADSHIRRYDGALGAERTKKASNKGSMIPEQSDTRTTEGEKNADLGDIMMSRKLQAEGEDDEDGDEALAIDEDLEANTQEALERHDFPPEERDVIGDSIFPFGGSQSNNIFDRQTGNEEYAEWGNVTHVEETVSEHYFYVDHRVSLLVGNRLNLIFSVPG
jgi:hypothetical protein